MEEVPVIALDHGSGFCKAGYVGEDAPRTVFPSIVGFPFSQSVRVGLWHKDFYVGDEAQARREILTLRYPIQRGIITHWDEMIKLWNHMFGAELRAEADEHPVLLTESPLNPKANREKMAEVMFEHFGVPALCIAPNAVMSLIASGRYTGVVVDCGHSVCNIVPIYEGFVLSEAVHQLPFGGQDLSTYLMELLIQRGCPITNKNLSQVNEMKETSGYVVENFDQELKVPSNSDRESSFELPDGQRITIGNERFQCAEPLFQPSLLGLECLGIHQATQDSIMMCDASIQRSLYGNVILSGGSTLFPSFSNRMNNELSKLVPNTKVGVVTSERHSTWFGGTIFASLPYFLHNCVFTHEYDEIGPSIVNIKR